MPIGNELKTYAMRLGFPESENLGGVFSILFDDDESIRLVQALPGSLQELSHRTGLPLKNDSQAAKPFLKGFIDDIFESEGGTRLCR